MRSPMYLSTQVHDFKFVEHSKSMDLWGQSPMLAFSIPDRREVLALKGAPD
jgi:hypothetical protein